MRKQTDYYRAIDKEVTCIRFNKAAKDFCRRDGRKVIRAAGEDILCHRAFIDQVKVEVRPAYKGLPTIEREALKRIILENVNHYDPNNAYSLTQILASWIEQLDDVETRTALLNTIENFNNRDVYALCEIVREKQW